MVTEDGARVDPGAEIAALFGPRAVIVLAGTDAADVVLDSREELSIRWHPLPATSPNIGATVRVVAGDLSAADLVEAGLAVAAGRGTLDESRRLDAIVRDAVYAQKALARGKRWEAVPAAPQVRQRPADPLDRRDAPCW